MKAVNLIPQEERRSGRASLLSGVSGPTRGVLGGLLLALVVLVAYVSLSNGVAERRAQLSGVEAAAVAAEQRAAALKPYGDVATLRQTSLATVRALAGSRFDWTGLLAELSRRVPADVTLTSFDGSSGGGDPATAGTAGTSVKLAGCTTDHTAVAKMMERMRAVRGVASVSLASSAKAASGTGAGCPRADTFQLALTLSTPATPPAPAAAAPATDAVAAR